MKNCPDCRNPVSSLMFIDSKPAPELYCERCCRAVKPVAAEPREPVLR